MSSVNDEKRSITCIGPGVPSISSMAGSIRSSTLIVLFNGIKGDGDAEAYMGEEERRMGTRSNAGRTLGSRVGWRSIRAAKITVSHVRGAGSTATGLRGWDSSRYNVG